MIRLSAREHSGTGACRIMASFRQQRSEILQPPLFLSLTAHLCTKGQKKKDAETKGVNSLFPSPSPGPIKNVAMTANGAIEEELQEGHLTSCPTWRKKPHSALSNGSLLCWGQQHYGVESTMEKKGFPAGQCRGFSGTGCCSNTLCLNITC